MHGSGIFKHKSGAIYVGEWQLGRRHGAGNEKWPDGSEYTG
jgi:hypothetical protein